MFGGVFVARGGGFLAGTAQHDLAVIPPGGFGGVALNLRQSRDKARHLVHDLVRQVAVGGNQPGGRVRSVFRLADQIVCHDIRIGGAVCDNQDLGRAGEQIYADTPEQQPLGFRDEAVAGTDQDIRLVAGKQAERHRRNALNAAQCQDMVGLTQVHGVEDRRVDAAAFLARGGTGDDILDTGDFCRRDTHDGRGDMSVTAAGHVAAGSVDRDQPLPGPKARRQFGLEGLHAVLLLLGEQPHPVIGELQIVLQLIRHLPRRGFDLVGTDLDIAVPTVELLAIGARGVLAAPFDLVQHLADDFPGFVLAGGGCFRRAFQIFGRHGGSLSCRGPCPK